MIVPRLRSEARGGTSSGTSTRYSNSAVYGGKVHHGNHSNDPDLKRALQYSYTSQTVRKWEKRWVVIHETSMRVHKWMPAPVTASTLASQIVADKTAALADDTPSTMESGNVEQLVEQPAEQDKQAEAIESDNGTEEASCVLSQDTQMLVDEESVSQSSQP
jgi:hypothetical protein